MNFALSSAASEAQPNEPAANSSPSNSDTPQALQGGQSVASDKYPGVYRVGGDVSPPKALYSPNPSYSEEARKAKFEGTVVLWLVVDAGGLPQQIRVQRSLGMGLDEEAIKAVKQWRFQPATKDGKPVPVMINVEMNFRLYGELYPHPDSRSQPPRFPGVDLSEYPLVVRLTAGSPSWDARGVTFQHKKRSDQ